ncbi:SMP-30/gluconolactonase/LRE family protein [Sphingobacterium sp. DK4209]|uniref:SMP-30/gluconolactonase/LRE family protein n=1 Tax=Sphingobacterium zhuxiongii TaxID=2662364 RepID=A0A5Q0QBZ3_9SPHI|nr:MULTISPECIES: SMP-30/gluconolactonase/LRE family protein [unclassified Sphingobacterium]MVZ64678.1 SMP-30/gluconolactonase/LRE family protein [Sphingobacterium sp. DK4209]QGA27016.1 SMP-30/gluconolactonase/LRE family protein [Sphingobacterium sp. dk4302]
MKAILFSSLLLFSSLHSSGQQTKIEILNPSMNKIIHTDVQIENLGEGMVWAEGPVWNKKGQYLLFSDPRLNTIFQWDKKNGLRPFLKPSGYEGETWYSDEPGTNGLLINAEGTLIACDHGNRRITQIDLTSKAKSAVVSNWEGKRFNSPNDLCEHPQGYYFFTDPPYGLPARLTDTVNREIQQNGVYRFNKKDQSVSQVISNLDRPNGIALSPDGKKLYIALSDDAKPYLMVYELENANIVGDGAVFFDFGKSFPSEKLRADGIKVDPKGNVYAAAGDGVVVINKHGHAIGRIRSGIRTANIAFGADHYLYMTASDRLLRVKLK